MNLIVVSDIYAYMKKLTTESFILKSKKVHGDKYDYSLVEYKDSHTHIDIICPTHNIFKQKPYCHLNKEGCRKCSDELKFQKRRHNKDIFIERSQKVHDNKYDYSLTMYRNSRTKVDIVCPKHGVFTQSPPHHLNGAGCPICKSSKGEIEVQKFLKNNMKVKIGDKIHDSNEEPIMLVLDDNDKENIKNMDSNKYKFITYPKGMSNEDVREWIDNNK